MRRRFSAAKELNGTLRRDRVNPRAPKPPAVEALRPRRSLAALAKVEHGRLVRALGLMRVLKLADAVALELLAQALGEYRLALAVLLRDGQSYACTTSAGATMFRARPEQAIAADAWRRAAHMLEQFGMTPVSRPKVEGDDGLRGAETDPMDAFLARRACKKQDLASPMVQSFPLRRRGRAGARLPS